MFLTTIIIITFSTSYYIVINNFPFEIYYTIFKFTNPLCIIYYYNLSSLSLCFMKLENLLLCLTFYGLNQKFNRLSQSKCFLDYVKATKSKS